MGKRLRVSDSRQTVRQHERCDGTATRRFPSIRQFRGKAMDEGLDSGPEVVAKINAPIATFDTLRLTIKMVLQISYANPSACEPGPLYDPMVQLGPSGTLRGLSFQRSVGSAHASGL